MMGLETSVDWIGDYEQRVITAPAYPGYRVRIEWDKYSQDALDSQAMSAVVRFDRYSAELHTGCGTDLNLDAIARAWREFEHDEDKFVRWFVQTGQAYAVEIVQAPEWNKYGYLVAATREWVETIWTPDGEETTPEHIASAKAALPEEAKTVTDWVNGDVFMLVPEYQAKVSETVLNPAGQLVDESDYEEWREHDDYGPVGGFIGDVYAIAEATDMLTGMIRDNLKENA